MRKRSLGRCVSAMPALEGGATRIVDWTDQNLHDLFIPTYYHLLLSSFCAGRFFAYVLRNIKIDALFDVAYIKCKERRKDWHKNKAVFIFNLFCFVNSNTKKMRALLLKLNFSLKCIIRNSEISIFLHARLFFLPLFLNKCIKVAVRSHIAEG